MYKIYKNYLYFLTIIIVILFPINSFAIITKINNLKVIKVIDGDTIKAKDKSNNIYKIRLIGINATEISHNPAQPFSVEAKYVLNKLIGNKKIYIEVDLNSFKDKYGRILANVYKEKNNLWVNAEMIKNGLAYTYFISPNIPKSIKLLKLEDIAIKNKINLWNNPMYQVISVDDAMNYVAFYKIIDGTVNEIIITKNIIDLKLKSKNNNTLEIIIRTNILNTKKQLKYWLKLRNKKIRVRGFIEQNSASLNPFIYLSNEYNIEVLK